MTYNKEMITVIEVMGRNAGWLTGATALARTEECDGRLRHTQKLLAMSFDNRII